MRSRPGVDRGGHVGQDHAGERVGCENHVRFVLHLDIAAVFPDRGGSSAVQDQQTCSGIDRGAVRRHVGRDHEEPFVYRRILHRDATVNDKRAAVHDRVFRITRSEFRSAGRNMQLAAVDRGSLDRAGDHVQTRAVQDRFPHLAAGHDTGMAARLDRGLVREAAGHLDREGPAARNNRIFSISAVDQITPARRDGNVQPGAGFIDRPVAAVQDRASPHGTAENIGLAAGFHCEVFRESAVQHRIAAIRDADIADIAAFFNPEVAVVDGLCIRDGAAGQYRDVSACIYGQSRRNNARGDFDGTCNDL